MYIVLSYLNISPYCTPTIFIIESLIAYPDSSNTVHPTIPKTVILVRFLYLNIFLAVTLFENFNLFHINLICSNKIFLPFGGALGLKRSVVFSLIKLLIVIIVEPQIHTTDIVIPKVDDYPFDLNPIDLAKRLNPLIPSEMIAFAAITAIRPALGQIFGSVEVHTTSTALTRAAIDLNVVDKISHSDLLSCS